jgi:predicted RNase H-like nuclease (RuvC/YqgF family)
MKSRKKMLRSFSVKITLGFGFFINWVGYSTAQVHSDTLLKQILLKVNEVSENQNQWRKEWEEGRRVKSEKKLDSLKYADEIERLKSDNSALKEKNESLSKSKQLNEVKALKSQKDSLEQVIKMLSDTLDKRGVQLKSARGAFPLYQTKGEEAGMAKTLEKGFQFYNSKPLDTLIVNTNLFVVQRDMAWFSMEKKTIDKVKLLELEHYFLANSNLHRRYSDESVQIALSHLEKIKSKSEQVEKLRERLEMYKDYNKALKATLEEILKLDKQVSTANDKNAKEFKLNKINIIISKYIYNYSDFIHYPYLQDRLNEVILLKNDDPEADLSVVLKKI